MRMFDSMRHIHLVLNDLPGVDPGFSVGGADPFGVPTSDAGTIRQKRMRKRKNWVLLGGGGAGCQQRLLDPPMFTSYVS